MPMTVIETVANDTTAHLLKNLNLRSLTPQLLVSLHTADPGASGVSEIVDDTYQRQGVEFNPSSSGQLINTNRMNFFGTTSIPAVITEQFYFDNFNRPEVGYCQGGQLAIGPNWRTYVGCPGIDGTNGWFKQGLNYADQVRTHWDRDTPVLQGQYSKVRLKSWRGRPQMGLVCMATNDGSQGVSNSQSGYRASIHPGGTGIIDPVVRIYRHNTLLMSQVVPGHPRAEWQFAALPFVDHTFLQLKREGHTWMEYSDFGPGFLSEGYLGLDKNGFLPGDQDSGYDVKWDDWEGGGASAGEEIVGGGPECTITHIGLWTPQGEFVAGLRLNDPVDVESAGVFFIDVGNLKITVTKGTDFMKNPILDRFGLGLQFTTAPAKISLHTADPGTTGLNEVEDSRTNIPTTSWGNIESLTLKNAVPIEMRNLGPCTVTHVGLWSDDDEFLLAIAIPIPVVLALPSQTLRIPSDRLQIGFPLFRTGTLVSEGEATVAFSGYSINEGSLLSDGVATVAFGGADVQPGSLLSDGVATVAFGGQLIFGGWNTWVDTGDNGTGLNNYPSLGDSASRIYYGVATGSGGNNRFRSLLKSDLTTFTTHTTPFSHLNILSIVAMDDDDTVFIGSGNGGGAVAYKFTHSGGFTNLTWPGDSSDGIFIYRHPTNSDILFISNQATSASGELRLYEYTISSTTWTQIGGDGNNGSWNLNGSNRSIAGLTFDDTYIYLMAQGGGVNLDNVYRATLDDYTDWTIIGGGGVNGSWATGTKRNGRLMYAPYTGKLYACIGGASDGDAEVWECTDPQGDTSSGPSWTQIGGDGINSSWSAGTTRNCSRVALLLTKLVTAIAGTASADSDVWMWDLETNTWTQEGGDSIDSGWSGSGQSQVNAVHIDREGRLWATPSNNATGTPALWYKSVA